MSQPRLRAGALRRVPDTIDSLGAAPAPLLARAGLDSDPAAWGNACVRTAQVLTLLDMAADHTGEREFGALVGSRTTVELGEVATVLQGDEPLGLALRHAAALAGTIREGVTFRLVDHRRRAEFREILDRSVDAAANVQLIDGSLSAVLALLRQRLGPAFTPALVRLPPGRGRSADNLERILRAPVQLTDEAPPAIVFPFSLATALAEPSRAAAAARLPVPDAVAAMQDVDLERSCRLIAAGMSEFGQRPSLDGVAATLGVPARTLQWRLNRLQLSFHALCEDVLKRRAEELVATSDLSITRIAMALGYDDLANFTRAFRRWFGVSPGRYRQAAQPAAARRPRVEA